MFKKIRIVLLLSLAAVISGCATVPMAPQTHDELRKRFDPPSSGMAGVYVYRNSSLGRALKKTLSLDGEVIGETANGVYFYQEVEPGSHVISTESEFGDNTLRFDAGAGSHYFFQQHLRMGVFVGGAYLKEKTKEEGMAAIKQCKLAKSFNQTYAPLAPAIQPTSNKKIAVTSKEPKVSKMPTEQTRDTNSETVAKSETATVAAAQDETDKPLPVQKRKRSSKPRDIVACKQSYSYLFSVNCQ